VTNDTKYLDSAAAASLLGCSLRTLERLRSNGGGPAFTRLGPRRVVYSGIEIERWVAANTFPHRAAEAVCRAA
jgi:predicted DNA-binding transcriptional regulator AlpA